MRESWISVKAVQYSFFSCLLIGECGALGRTLFGFDALSCTLVQDSALFAHATRPTHFDAGSGLRIGTVTGGRTRSGTCAPYFALGTLFWFLIVAASHRCNVRRTLFGLDAFAGGFVPNASPLAKAARFAHFGTRSHGNQFVTGGGAHGSALLVDFSLVANHGGRG